MQMQSSADLRSFPKVDLGSNGVGGAWQKSGVLVGKSNKTDEWKRARLPNLFRPMRFLCKSRSFICKSTSCLLVVNLMLAATFTGSLEMANSFIAAGPAADSVHLDDWREVQLAISEVAPSGAFDVISDRPLFESSRRPPASAPRLDPELSVELIGTLLSDNGRAALVRLGTDARATWVREGDYVDSWQIEKIHTDRLQLRRIDEMRMVHLDDGANLTTN